MRRSSTRMSTRHNRARRFWVSARIGLLPTSAPGSGDPYRIAHLLSSRHDPRAPGSFDEGNFRNHSSVQCELASETRDNPSLPPKISNRPQYGVGERRSSYSGGGVFTVGSVMQIVLP